MKRKEFLQLSSVGLAGLCVPAIQKDPKPVFIATWPTGKAVAYEGWQVIRTGGTALDAIETAGKFVENTIDCCVGLGGYPDRDGVVSLDACIMNGEGDCGAVAGLEQVKHPISVARKVMTTPHVLFVGKGAQQFALQSGFTLEPRQLSPSAEAAYKKWLLKNNYQPEINIENNKNKGPFAPAFLEDGSPNHDTMAMLGLDGMGQLAGGVTTSGMAFKMPGRVGDSPIIGAGLFVDKEVGAATSSGVGEEVIRISGSHTVIEYMRQGFSPELACKKAIQRIIARNPAKAKTFQVGFMAIDKKGRHGAYAIQKGFSYAVKSEKEDAIYPSKYLL